MTTYHVGLRVDKNTALFEFRRNIDYLSCEILEYFGEREGTKKGARERLKVCKAKVLADLQSRYPKYGFRRVAID